MQRRILPLIARRARRVITVSEFSRDELAELLGVDADGRLGGVDAALHARGGRPSARTRPYVLCVASHTARKNLARSSRPRRRWPATASSCVVAGGHRPQFAAEAGLDGLTLLGHVARRRAARPLRRRRGVRAALASTRASACRCWRRWRAGTPVVAADTTALPETCGGAARLVEPEPEAIRDALTACSRDDAERARLRALGLARRPRFTWERTAREVDAVVSGSGGGDDAAQRRREAQQVQARLRGRLGGRDALLGDDRVGGVTMRGSKRVPAAFSSSSSASAWLSCGPPRAVSALQVSATATMRERHRRDRAAQPGRAAAAVPPLADVAGLPARAARVAQRLAGVGDRVAGLGAAREGELGDAREVAALGAVEPEVQRERVRVAARRGQRVEPRDRARARGVGERGLRQHRDQREERQREHAERPDEQAVTRGQRAPSRARRAACRRACAAARRAGGRASSGT